MNAGHRTWRLLLAFAVIGSPAQGSDLDEFKVKRQPVFEFAQKPAVVRRGDTVTITFASKAFCDVTVAIENAEGRIVRHLASGVLGKSAPPPFQKDSLKQVVVWDGKDDQGVYVDDKDALTVRVSLGLRARFERTLFWSPKKRVVPAPPFYWNSTVQDPWPSPPLIQATEEGVFVYNGHNFDYVYLFDHKGEYVRTVYPFPADKVGEVKGLTWHRAPQDGRRLPLRPGAHNTFLTSGDNVLRQGDGYFGTGATAMAVRKGRIALAMLSLNRLATDGSSGGMNLHGPKMARHVDHGRSRNITVPPRSAALSPDGRWLYLTRYGYVVGKGFYGYFYYIPGVFRLDMNADAAPQLFLGGSTPDEAGTGDSQFRTPSSVACDSRGRVYVSDQWNDRVQVFSPEGKHLKTFAVEKPVQVCVHQRTGDIYVFSWMFHSHFLAAADKKGKVVIRPTLTCFGPLKDPARRASYPLPLEGHRVTYASHSARGGWQYEAKLDSWTDPPTIWLVPGMPDRKGTTWEQCGIRIYALKDGELKLKRDFGKETQKSVGRARPPERFRQHLYVNPKTGMLYIAELDTAMYHCWRNLLRFDPATGARMAVRLPFYVQDMAFDINGLAYLRWYNLIARFDAKSWREVPWDYGEEKKGVGMVPNRRVVSALVAPGKCGFGYFGGMSISPGGKFAFSTSGTEVESGIRRAGKLASRWFAGQGLAGKAVPGHGKPYKAQVYPGRRTGYEVHIWDEHGALVCEDAVPGLFSADGGVAIDKDDNIYVMAHANRVLDGKPYFRSTAGTLMKFKPKQGRFLTSSPTVPVPLPQQDQPKRTADFVGRDGRAAWAQNVEWMYGGVGYLYKERWRCYCWKSRFALDYFGRSFAPELDHYSVAVLDTNGAVILRIGRYGNADSAGPKSRVPLGGDEVGLFYPQSLAVHTDQRLFISDVGNARILSVKLGYHATETVALQDVRAEKK